MKNRFLLSVFCLLLLVAVVLSGVGCAKKGGAENVDQDATGNDAAQDGEEQEQIDEKISYNVEDYITSAAQVRSMHTEQQLAYINGNLADLPSDSVKGTSEQSLPAFVKLTWDAVAGATEYTVVISERPDLKNALERTPATNSVSIENLKAKTVYWYQVTSNNGVKSDVMAFMTDAALPRTLRCPGVTNMRDLGGYVAAGDKVVKQDMIFRSGRLNKNSSSTVTEEISKAGKKFMLETLGIKTEIDLRQEKDVTCLNTLGEGTERSVLGKSVKYYNCAMEYDPSAYQSANFAAVKQVFAILADEASYPLFFHCSIGTDRTGFIAYLIGGVLGVDKVTLQRDYLFSNFGNIGGSRSLTTSSFVRYVEAIDSTAGDTFQEKVENFLVRTIGVKKEHIDKLRAIMLEDAVYENGVVVEAPTATENGLALFRCTSDPAKTYYAVMPAGKAAPVAAYTTYGEGYKVAAEKIGEIVLPARTELIGDEDDLQDAAAVGSFGVRVKDPSAYAGILIKDDTGAYIAVGYREDKCVVYKQGGTVGGPSYRSAVLEDKGVNADDDYWLSVAVFDCRVMRFYTDDIRMTTQFMDSVGQAADNKNLGFSNEATKLEIYVLWVDNTTMFGAEPLLDAA